ncbi:MAG TPA: hypothetical protein VEB20_17000, partial [Azospirillaceae bacterium]|nr:hypothetical protein [Azospirillaceae bacterium]
GRFETGDTYQVTGRSVLMFALEPDGKVSTALGRAADALRQLNEQPVVLPVEPVAEAEEEEEGADAGAEAPAGKADTPAK